MVWIVLLISIQTKYYCNWFRRLKSSYLFLLSVFVGFLIDEQRRRFPLCFVLRVSFISEWHFALITHLLLLVCIILIIYRDNNGTNSQTHKVLRAPRTFLPKRNPLNPLTRRPSVHLAHVLSACAPPHTHTGGVLASRSVWQITKYPIEDTGLQVQQMKEEDEEEEEGAGPSGESIHRDREVNAGH